MPYQTEAITTTLSDLQGHSPTTSLFKCYFSYTVQQLTNFN